MSPDGYNSITVPDEAFEHLTEIMIEYECESSADAVAAALAALEHDEAISQAEAQLTE